MASKKDLEWQILEYGASHCCATMDDNDQEDNTPSISFMQQTVFMDHNQREGVVINPSSILSMRIQRNEAAWTDQRFDSKAQSI